MSKGIFKQYLLFLTLYAARACGPVVTQPERIAAATAAISASPMSGRAKGKKGWSVSWLMAAALQMKSRHCQAVIECNRYHFIAGLIRRQSKIF